MKERGIDLTESNMNIDTMLDVYVQTQKEMGKDPELVESDDVDDSGNIVKSKDVVDHTDCSKCSHECKDSKKDKFQLPWYMQNRLGLFEDSMSPELDDDDDDECYICEYCTEIGYKKEYKPYLCDSCESCETCPEFSDGDCSGCSYSVYRTGRFYSQELASDGEMSFLESDEQDIVDAIESDEYDDEPRNPDLSFSIMDYDHKY